jgi:hypothetical protein
MSLLRPAVYDDNNRSKRFKVYQMQAKKAIMNVIYRDNLQEDIRNEYDKSGSQRTLVHAVVDILLKIVNSAYPKPNEVDLPISFMIGSLALQEVVGLLNASGRNVTQDDVNAIAPQIMIVFMNQIKGRYDIEKYKFYMQDLQKAADDGRIKSIMDLDQNKRN